MKCPNCGKNMIVADDGVLENFWWCKCGKGLPKPFDGTITIHSFPDKEQRWRAANPIPCPDCDSTGHIFLGFKKELWSPIVEEQGQEMPYLVVKHCPRCKGSGEVVQDAH